MRNFPIGEGRVHENEANIAQPPPPPPNDVESPARKTENGKCAPPPETEPTSVEEGTATATATEEDASKAAPEAVATSPAAAANAEKHKPQGDCVVCGHLARNFCSSCKHVFYCTRLEIRDLQLLKCFKVKQRWPKRSPEETLEGPQGGVQEPGDIALSGEPGGL